MKTSDTEPHYTIAGIQFTGAEIVALAREYGFGGSKPENAKKFLEVWGYAVFTKADEE